MAEVGFYETVVIYQNGQDALDGLTAIIANGEKFPSVIFLDLDMPIMNGWEFLEEFENIPNNNAEKVVIYIVSSSVDPRDLERIKNYKIVNNYILKPFSKEDLNSILETPS